MKCIYLFDLAVLSCSCVCGHFPPRKARRKGIEAVVILSLFIDERGNVARTEVVSVDAKKYRKSFARASKKAAMRSKFYPKTVGGKSVATSNYLRQYTFTFEE